MQFHKDFESIVQNVYDVGDFDTASRILIADIFAKKESKDRGKWRSEQSKKCISFIKKLM